MSLVLLLGLTHTRAQDSLSYILDRHHEAHQQELWEEIKSLSAKGNWLSLHGSYPATFYFKNESALAYVWGKALLCSVKKHADICDRERADAGVADDVDIFPMSFPVRAFSE